MVLKSTIFTEMKMVSHTKFKVWILHIEVRMLAIAIARTDVELSPEVTGQYLFNTGYMAKSKYAKLSEIVQRAFDIREKR